MPRKEVSSFIRFLLQRSQCEKVTLTPIIADGTWQPAIDDEWIPTELSERGLRIRNVRTHHAPLVGLDHIHHYVSDPERDGNGLRHGFLDLNVQLILSGCNVFTEPLRRHRPHRRAARTSG